MAHGDLTVSAAWAIIIIVMKWRAGERDDLGDAEKTRFVMQRHNGFGNFWSDCSFAALETQINGMMKGTYLWL